MTDIIFDRAEEEFMLPKRTAESFSYTLAFDWIADGGTCSVSPGLQTRSTVYLSPFIGGARKMTAYLCHGPRRS